VSKARDLIGFEPRVVIDNGVEIYVKWFLEREKRRIDV
jgi:nucleoside-diphosphate-sugar epimerase